MPLSNSQGVLKMKKVTLNNGLTVIARSFPSEYASLHVDVGFGTYHEAQAVLDYDNGVLTGANHFIEHLVFGDTRRYSSEEIAKLDASCGEANAEEGVINTDYWVGVFSPENLDHILSIMTSILFGAMFKSEDVERERDIILSEIRVAHDNITETDKNNFLIDFFTRTMYEKHPFRLPVIGTEETIRSLERKVLFDLYQKYYVPNNMIIAIVGGIDEEGTIEAVRKHFGHYPRGEIPQLKSVDEPEKKEPIEVPFESRDVEQNYLILGVRTIHQAHKGDYILTVIDDILGGGSYSRLFREIRKKEGLAYSPETKHNSVHDEGYFRVYSQAPPTDHGVNDVKGIILENLHKLAIEPVTKEELELSKGALIEGYERMLVDIDDLAGDLCWYERLGIGVENYKDYPTKIKVVTAADIQKFAQEHLSTKGYVLVGVKPKNS